jgi:hypothetical protein
MSHTVYRPKQNERGSARAKLIIFLAVFAIIIYVGYMYIPVAVDAYYFKDAMQNKVDAAATQGFDTAWVKDQLEKTKNEFNVPRDATIAPAQKDNQMTVRVQFTRPISFPGYTYNYEFDHTAISKTYLFK